MNRSLPTKLVGKSAISVAFVCSIALRLLGEPPDPTDRTGPNAAELGTPSDGTVVTWGSNGAGQLNVPAPNAEFVAVAGGSLHSLGLRADGSIVAWGRNNDGQLNVPAPNTGFVAVSANQRHSLGLKGDGSVVGWGGNAQGQLNVPAPNAGFVAIAAGLNFSLGLKGDGSIVAWGLNDFGQCNVPAPNAGFVGVSAGTAHGLGLQADGSVVGWGWCALGQCDVPPPNMGFVAVASGNYHSLGLKGDGSVVVWGCGGDVNFGQCDEPSPNSGFVSISAGYDQSLGLRSNGSIVAWGCGGSVNYETCNPPSPNASFVAVAAGYFHCLGVHAATGTCPCNANVNNDIDGFVNGADEDIVLNCINGNCSGCVNDCDVNCDGAVDWVDMGIVRCRIMGQSNCCSVATGGCTGMNLPPNVYDVCEVTSAATCSRYQGSYLGNGTTCAGCVCNADVNNNGMVNALDWACVVDCAKYNLCTCCVNSCDVNCDGGVDYTDLAATWCEHQGSSNCCNVAIGACMIPTGDWPNCIETSQSPCQFFGGTYYGNGSTCAQICAATRVFADADYCPGRVKLVRIELGSLTGVSAISVADSPPASWTVGAISNGGSYDAVNHKVKWGPLFSPFPAELTYEVTPNVAAAGQLCFSGVISVDGVNRTFCGDDCLNYQCCPYITAETPQPICTSCSAGNCAACTGGSCLDGSVSLCEIIAYGCAWVRGCNDDIAAVTRAAFVWRNGECYCWDDAIQNFVPTACGAGNICCPAGGAAAAPEEYSLALGSAQARVTRNGQRGGSREWQVSIDVMPAIGTSATAVELIVPHGWKVTAVGENGAFDRENGKIKWGPYFGDAAQTLTATVRPGVRRDTPKVKQTMEAMLRSLSGTVSFDGVNSPVTITR
jgi:hypothetical protein